MGGLIAGWFGKRKTVLIFSPVVAVGWILVGASQSTIELFAGRVLISIGSAVMMAVPSKSENIHSIYGCLHRPKRHLTQFCFH